MQRPWVPAGIPNPRAPSPSSRFRPFLTPRPRLAVPAWPFAATALAAVHAGTVPVLVDVDADTLNMDPRSLAATLATGVDAVVPVHFGGVPVSHWIHDLSRVAGVPVVEDAA